MLQKFITNGFKMKPPINIDNIPVYATPIEDGALGKGKCWKRSEMKEGDPNLPWEKEAYDKTDPYEAL